MNELVRHCLIIGLPLIVSNILHMIAVKKDLWSFLSISISARLFGKNKTWRGFVFMITANAILLTLCNILLGFKLEAPIVLGAVFGFIYLVFELPNSYLKRKVGIKAGDNHQRFKYFFWWIDKSDSTSGLCLVYYLLGYVTGKDAFLMYLILFLTHVLISKLLVYLKIKKSF
ncbi:MAG: hypothetical protein ACJAZ2_000744 [Glaciecola sp.]|jgi:hypothetical protein